MTDVDEPTTQGRQAHHWVPISKALAAELPSSRPFTRLEAMFSLSIDYDQGTPVTVKGYAALWGWSRGKVERFLEEIGAVIEYPESTGNKQNQRGQIMIQITSRSRADNRQIKIIDSKWLGRGSSRSRADDGQITSRSQGTTKNPYPYPYKNTSGATALFDLWNTVTGGRLPAAMKLSESRKTKCVSRLKERPLEGWREVFERMATSRFCQEGKWCTFDWIIKNDENALKVLEGKYDNQIKQPEPPSSQSRPLQVAL